jgi:hypothetical protein
VTAGLHVYLCRDTVASDSIAKNELLDFSMAGGLNNQSHPKHGHDTLASGDLELSTVLNRSWLSRVIPGLFDPRPSLRGHSGQWRSKCLDLCRFPSRNGSHSLQSNFSGGNLGTKSTGVARGASFGQVRGAFADASSNDPEFGIRESQITDAKP